MSITLSALQKQRRDSAANWTFNNPTLLAGELGYESDTGKWKVGDGTTAWTGLAYIPGSQISAYPLVNADIATGAEIAVSKLADGAARQLLQTDAAGTGVEWTSNIDVPGTLDVTGAVTFDNNLTVQGDLYVNGTEVIINTQTLEVEDKNVIIGKVATPTDVTADGGGITLKGTTDKTITWLDATDAWTLSEHVNIASAKEYRIAGTKVLDATSLGSAIVSSSLTTVGTIGSGTWNGTTVATGYGGTGQTTYTDGQLLIGKTNGSLAKATLTAGSNVTITNGDGTISIAATAAAGTLTSSDIGVTVQGYDADTAKLDVAQTFTAVQTFASGQRYPQIPANNQTSAYTLVASDAGKHISITTGGVTVPASVFSVGDAVTIYNKSASSQTIAQGASVTLRQVGTATTGNRTLAQYGLATILCVASNEFVISGGGLS